MEFELNIAKELLVAFPIIGFLGTLAGIIGKVAVPLLGGLFGGKKKKQEERFSESQRQMATQRFGEQTQALGELGKGISAGRERIGGFLDLAGQQAREGSSTLQRRQADVWNRTAEMFRKITGAGQQGLFQSGHGFAPSGTGAALAGSMQRQAGKTASDLLFQNIVQNEKFKQRGLELGFQGTGQLSSLLGVQSQAASQYDPSRIMGTSRPAPERTSPWANLLTSAPGIIGGVQDIFKKKTGSSGQPLMGGFGF